MISGSDTAQGPRRIPIEGMSTLDRSRHGPSVSRRCGSRYGMFRQNAEIYVSAARSAIEAPGHQISKTTQPPSWVGPPNTRSAAFHRHNAHAPLGPRPKQLSHRFLTNPTPTPFHDQPSELWGVTGLAMVSPGSRTMVLLRALPIVSVSAVLVLCVSSSAASEDADTLLDPTVHKFDHVAEGEAVATLLEPAVHKFDHAAEGEPVTLLEPTVHKFDRVLPKEACDELIRLGEQEGFGIGDHESIDDQQERAEGVVSSIIWEALQPYIPLLTDYVKKSIDKETDEWYFPEANRTPKLDWVFFRKYSPETERNSNMHTLNIALNDDFEGGGLFYAKPVADQEFDRENTSELVFPDMHAGDVLVHNFTVWHAVAPIERGTRYSFVLFYDMDNPAIQGDFDENYVDATFYHEITSATIDLMYVEFLVDENGRRYQEKSEVVEEDMQPFEEVNFGSYKGHVFRAVERDSKEVLAEFVIDHDVEFYEIESLPRHPPQKGAQAHPSETGSSSSDEL
ncbi:hypothetical protein THAOC_34497 [Thalassiosira oceanica]|uniref:Uncharacterized protein n=1 Tax=Thalassiosira oceanica TaxID=159749 RepID=K0R2E7_THAOC|nr:hypothetical protein THAOC_34497 [Thalassiosira oceanica]|eukprot:EJK46818.1 hypothetical protein THAOC_34497 [Thalassiosira oceanica]